MELAVAEKLADPKVVAADTTAQEAAIPWPNEMGLMASFFSSVRAASKRGGQALKAFAEKASSKLKAVVCQNLIVALDERLASSDAGAQCPSYSLSWAPRVQRSGPIIARQPVPPDERVAGIPGPLSAIAMKLLAKNAEDR